MTLRPVRKVAYAIRISLLKAKSLGNDTNCWKQNDYSGNRYTEDYRKRKPNLTKAQRN